MTEDSSKEIVSIIMPTNNGERFIARAIESVIGQDFKDWRLYIVDDGSTDGTEGIIRSYAARDARISRIKNASRQGIQRSLNAGLRASRGRYVARIDDDDAWIDAGKLAAQAAFLDASPACVLVGTGARLADESGAVLGACVMPESDSDIRSRMLMKNCFLHPTIMMRRAAAEAAGGYDESPRIRHAEDYDLWLRLGSAGTLANLRSASVLITVRPGSVTSSNRVAQALRSLGLIVRHRRAYPGFAAGCIVSAARLAFFALARILPIPARFIYRIQARFKSA